MHTPFVYEVRTGKIESFGYDEATNPLDQTWETAMFKHECPSRVKLTEDGLEGDEVADPHLYGGKDKALFTYPGHHYLFWSEQTQHEAMSPGAMGEHLILEGTDEYTTFIGDTYQFGDAIIQVTQPRLPCWRFSRRFRNIDLAKEMQMSGRTGWYYRVLEAGDVWGNTTLMLLERPYPQWSVAAVNEVLFHRPEELRLTYELQQCTSLGREIKDLLSKQLRGQRPSMNKRLYGNHVE